MNDKPVYATSDFPPECQAEAVAVAGLQRTAAVMHADLGQLLAKDREAIQKHLKGITDILKCRREELESIAYTAKNPLPFRRMF